MGSIRSGMTRAEREKKYWIKPAKRCIHASGRGEVMTVMHVIQVQKRTRDGRVKTVVNGVKCRWVEQGVEMEGIFHTKELKEYHA